MTVRMSLLALSVLLPAALAAPAHATELVTLRQMIGTYSLVTAPSEESGCQSGDGVAPASAAAVKTVRDRLNPLEPSIPDPLHMIEFECTAELYENVDHPGMCDAHKLSGCRCTKNCPPS
jgi:hypothetical protein